MERSAPPPEQTNSKFAWKLVVVAAKNFFLLLCLFLALFSWILGSLSQQASHIPNLTIGFVDYDNGAVGAALRDAYTSLSSGSFPVVAEYSPTQYPTPEDLRAAVCRTDFWAVVYVSRGASARLGSALAGTAPVDELDKKDVLTYIWNEVRYPVVVDSAIATNLETLSSTARVLYANANTTRNILNVTAPEALSVLVEPWQLNSSNIQPTKQGPRLVYNTIVVLLVFVQDFFYLGMLNTIYGHLKIWTKARPIVIVFVRLVNSLIYTLLSGLCVTGAIWAFRGDWNVNGAQFMLTWMVFWILGHINFFVLDIFAVWLPAPYVPMAMISWVLSNVTSIVLPFELNPGFYKLGYVFPAHAAFTTFLDIWSSGCNPQLAYTLPTLFAWEVLAAIGSAIGVYRRVWYAKLDKEREEQSLKEKVAAVLELELRHRETPAQAAQAEPTTLNRPPISKDTDIEATAADEADEAEIAEALNDIEERVEIERRKSQAGAPMNYTLDLPFDC